MAERLFEISARIVLAQASVNPMSCEEIELNLFRTFSALQKLQRAEEEGTAVDGVGRGANAAKREGRRGVNGLRPEESVREDGVVCLECGEEVRRLTNGHLWLHGLNLRDYRKKWGFPSNTVLAARSLSEAKCVGGTKMRTPDNLIEFAGKRKRLKTAPVRGGGGTLLFFSSEAKPEL